MCRLHGCYRKASLLEVAEELPRNGELTVDRVDTLAGVDEKLLQLRN